jgi:HlyD family secretion protein
MRDLLVLPAVLIAALGLQAPALAETASAAAAAAPEAQPTLPAITVSTVGMRTLNDRVIASGLVAPVERVQVAPLIEGQPIEALEAEVGDMVQAGQVLARLSNSTLALQKSQFEAQLAAAGATIAQAEAQLIETRSSADEARRVADRTAKLRQQGSASQAQADTALANAVSADARVMVATQSLEAARAQLALARAQLANIELQLERTEVKAPVAGKVVERNALIGGVASAAGQPMFVLIRDGALELNADVAERDLLRLKPGQKAVLRSAGATQTLNGTIRLVEPTIDGATRLGRARITVEASDAIRAGMFVEADILVDSREAVAVPVTAVGSSAEGTTVMKVTDGQVSRVRVETGIRENGYVEIVSGLAAGDLVVTKAGAFVRDGDRVNPVPAPVTN